MTIDTSGKWWVGSEASDVLEYLRAYEAEGHAVHEARVCKCQCGSEQFELNADREEGCAERTCVICRAKHLICDSEEYWDEAAPEKWKCIECGGETCNLGVGFSLYESENGNAPDVRWISVGDRCVTCGTLGSFVDWKVGYGPSYQLLEKV